MSSIDCDKLLDKVTCLWGGCMSEICQGSHDELINELTIRITGILDTSSIDERTNNTWTQNRIIDGSSIHYDKLLNQLKLLVYDKVL